MHETVRIDLTKETKRWNRIQVISAVALFAGTDVVVSSVYDIFKSRYTDGAFNYSALAIQIPLILLSVFMVRQAWKYGGVFSRHSLKMLRYAFGICATVLLLMAGVFGLIASKADFQTEVATKLIFMSLFTFLLVGLICVAVVVIIGRLQRSTIAVIEKPIKELLDDAAGRSKEAPPDAYSHIRIDRPAGLLWVALGGAVFVAGSVLGSILFDLWLTDMEGKGNPNALLNLSTLVEIGGVLLILKGRAYFTPTPEAVLAIDKRAPILYLRSWGLGRPKMSSRKSEPCALCARTQNGKAKCMG